MIRRDKYLQQMINAKHNGFPKVITGIRRCGKSYMLKEIFRQHLLESGVPQENIIILELDDVRNSKYRDPIILSDYIIDRCKGIDECYVFLDEIQSVTTIINPVFTDGKHIIASKDDEAVISFVDVVLGLSREPNIDLYVTGSNSKMLSSDVVTQFRDKATEIHISPLTFSEYYEYVKNDKQEALYEYMLHGGMPLAVLKNQADKENYLKELFRTTYFKDIIERNKIKKSGALDELCTILSTCTGELLNAEKIANTFVSQRKEKIDKNTVSDYIDYFIDAFIISEAKRYDLKGRKIINSTRKYYFADTGLRNARLDFMYSDEGQILENVIYNELIHNGYSVNVGTFDAVEKDSTGSSIRKNYEVDFMAVKDGETMYIQVTDNLNSESTAKREIRPFILLNDQIKKIIVVNKPIKTMKEQNGFTVVGIVDFLLSL
ncbi:MAG: ATP-binding protein [Spirochaetales bacterium]|nr:ATP-binding protein [Spirochaetales bacterium]